MKSKLIAVLFLCFGLICCAMSMLGPPPRPQVIVVSISVEKPYDTVWQAVIETLEELPVVITNMEKDSGLIRSDFIYMNREDTYDVYCECGGLGKWSEVSRDGRFNMFVKKTGDNSCDITVNTMYEQRIQFMGNVGTRECVSTGKLEAAIFKRVLEKIG